MEEMLWNCIQKGQKAQTLVEYTLVVGSVMFLLIAMTPMIKRGLQGMIKVMADQIGRQENADQAFGEGGYMESSYITTRVSTDKLTEEVLGVTNYVYDDVVSIEQEAKINLGFVEE